MSQNQIESQAVFQAKSQAKFFPIELPPSFLTLWIGFGLMGSLVKNLYAWMFARFMCGALRDEFKRTFEFLTN